MNYDLEKTHDAEIAPRMREIIDICKRHGIPVIASFAFRRRGGVSTLSTTFIPGEDGGELRAPLSFRKALATIRNN